MSERSKMTDRKRLEDAINRTPQVQRIEIGRKREGDEMIYRFVNVYGNDTLGYIASSEEWFSPNRKGEDEPEFYEVLFQSPICPTVREALADAVHSAEQDAESFLAGDDDDDPPVKVEPTLDPSEYEISSGYIGGMGMTYETATPGKLHDAIEKAARRNTVSSGEIVKWLLAGQRVEWQDSPNYYYDHSAGVIRRKRIEKPVQLIKCSCGHSVPQSQVMSASHGTSCPDCYDRMSN